MAARLTNPMTGTSKTLGPDEDEKAYRMAGWHDAIDQPSTDAAAPSPEPPPEGEQKPKKTTEPAPSDPQED